MKQPKDNFSKHSKDTLDNSLACLDESLVSQLDAHRASLSATVDSKKSYPKIYPWALAASITVASLITMVSLQNGTDKQTTHTILAQHDDMSYTEIDPEFLDTIEMLEVLGETYHAI